MSVFDDFMISSSVDKDKELQELREELHAIRKQRDDLLKGHKVTWMPIETARKSSKAMIMLARIINGELRGVDYGCWEFIENSDWDGAAVYDWSSLDGMEEPTHWAPEIEIPK